jgi:hypothetical protein
MNWRNVLLAGLLFAVGGYVFGRILALDRFGDFESALYRNIRASLPWIWALLVGGSGMLIEIVRQASRGR